MKINFKTKSLEELIGYWIATFRIYCQLMDLVEYSDEVGENYDFEAWLEDDAEEKSLSIMDLHESIEETSEKAYMFAAAARKSLEAVLVVALRSNDHRLMDEPVEDTDWDEKIGILMDYMEESFAEVCDYSAENEIENFYKVAKNAVKEISEGEY